MPVSAAVFLLLLAPLAARCDEVEDEFTFASGLTTLGFPDWSQRVLDELERLHPDQAGRVKVVRAESLLAQRRLADVEGLLKGMKADDPKADAIRLATANYYYRIGNVPQAKQLYNDFFARFKQVPTDPDLLRNYLDSAYRYAKMLETANDLPGAVQGYERLLAAKPESAVARHVMTDLSQVLLRQARAEQDAAKRTPLIQRIVKMCDDIQFGGTDIWFGQSIVTMAYAELLRGDKAKAMKMLKDYDEILSTIDEELKKAGAIAESPVAAVRFLRGDLMQQEAGALLEKNKKDEALRQYALAAQEFYNAFIQYPGCDVGPEAALRANQIKDVVKAKFGRELKIDMGPYADQAAGVLLRIADNLYRNKDYKGATPEYVKAANMFPQATPVIRSMTQLAICYSEQGDPLLTRVVVDYLGERFRENTNAAMALISVGNYFRERTNEPMYSLAYQSFLDNHPSNPMVPGVMFAFSSLKRTAGKAAEADALLEGIVRQFPQDQYFTKALSLLGWSYYASSNYAKALAGFQVYVKSTAPGVDQARAQFSLADCYVKVDDLTNAVVELEKLIGWLTPKDNPYAVTADQRAKNQGLLEKACFQLPYCLSRIKEPADQVPALRDRALKEFDRFLAQFPSSTLAPVAMSGKGRILLELGKVKEAAEVFNAIASKFPATEQGRNALYELARSAIEVKQNDQAKSALDQMLAKADNYRPEEFTRIGRLFLDEGLEADALRAFEQVLKPGGTTDRAVIEHALHGAGLASYRLKKYPDAVKWMNDLMTRYPKSGLFYEAKFILGEACRETGDFKGSIAALSDVMRYATNNLLMTRARTELARVQVKSGDRKAALASYQSLVLLADAKDPAIRPLILEASLGSIAMAEEDKKWKDVMEYCDQFLGLFPESKEVDSVRDRKNKARVASGGN